MSCNTRMWILFVLKESQLSVPDVKWVKGITSGSRWHWPEPVWTFTEVCRCKAQRYATYSESRPQTEAVRQAAISKAKSHPDRQTPTVERSSAAPPNIIKVGGGASHYSRRLLWRVHTHTHTQTHTRKFKPLIGICTPPLTTPPLDRPDKLFSN